MGVTGPRPECLAYPHPRPGVHDQALRRHLSGVSHTDRRGCEGAVVSLGAAAAVLWW